MNVSTECAACTSKLTTEIARSSEMSVEPNNLHTITLQFQVTFSVS
jgi:hypothetical protein